jgi:replication factor A1
MDQQGTEIKATFFNEACEKFYPILQEDSVYTFAVCKIKVAFQRKNQTPKTTGNQYELEFTTSSQICLATDVSFDTVVPVVHFIKIDKIAAQEVEGIVDVLGIVKAATNCHEIKSSKNSRVFQKRDLLIYDDSLTEVRVTLWDKYATDSTIDLVNTIISFRGMKVYMHAT